MNADPVVTSLILAPGSPENLRASVRRRVPFSALNGHLSEDGIRALRDSVGDSGGFRCWAVAERNRALWDGLSARTLVLFFEQGTGELTDEAVAIGKIRSTTLGRVLWREPWPYPFVIGHWRRHRIPKRRFVTELGYSPDYWVPGTIRVPDERLQEVRRKWGSVRAMLDALDQGR